MNILDITYLEQGITVTCTEGIPKAGIAFSTSMDEVP